MQKKFRNRSGPGSQLAAINGPPSNTSTVESYHEGEIEYLRALQHPREFSGVRIPSFLPLHTATARLQHTGSVSGNAAGYIKILFNPGSVLGVVKVYNISTLTEVTTGIVDSTLVIPPVTTTNALAWRVVSAEIRIWCITNKQTAAGLCSMSSVMVTASPSGITFDHARDQPGTVFGTVNDVFKGIYKPINSEAFDLDAVAEISTTHFMSPVFCVSGGANAQTYAYSVVCNYEYIPNSTFTDLVVTATAKTGSAEKAASAEIKAATINPESPSFDGGSTLSTAPSQQSGTGSFFRSAAQVLARIAAVTSRLLPNIRTGIPYNRAANAGNRVQRNAGRNYQGPPLTFRPLPRRFLQAVRQRRRLRAIAA